ncbi:hypothetical protein DWB61_15155 [Ancylomarina euxinus]|uniref:Uncharacterized protein n=1 Tax=Ancylomarina euxinus TaxID=2283627 RepID=A0A425XXV1_9BACT|nr:hypothetical protein DWB61_15155 [Ancylomarina euxinus]
MDYKIILSMSQQFDMSLSVHSKSQDLVFCNYLNGIKLLASAYMAQYKKESAKSQAPSFFLQKLSIYNPFFNTKRLLIRFGVCERQ